MSAPDAAWIDESPFASPQTGFSRTGKSEFTSIEAIHGARYLKYPMLDTHNNAQNSCSCIQSCAVSTSTALLHRVPCMYAISSGPAQVTSWVYHCPPLLDLSDLSKGIIDMYNACFSFRQQIWEKGTLHKSLPWCKVSVLHQPSFCYCSWQINDAQYGQACMGSDEGALKFGPANRVTKV